MKAFESIAGGFLKNLKVEDETQKQAFIDGLKGVCSDATKMTREADAVLQVCCAASAIHDTQATQIETYLQVHRLCPLVFVSRETLSLFCFFLVGAEGTASGGRADEEAASQQRLFQQ
jgi:hypothetical protein